MLRIKLRHFFTYIIIIGSIISLLLVWFGWIEIFGLKNDSYLYISSVLAILIPTTATFGVATLAIIFLTAQISAAYGKPAVLKELYRSNDIYILFGFLLLSVVGGYISLVLNNDLTVTILESKLLDSELILAIAAVLLILPTIMSQIENLDPVILASKLAARIKPKGIVEYGLTEVTLSENKKQVLGYKLVTVGLRPHSVDPLRPMHEIIMDAVKIRDRVLFGKLFRYLIQPIATVHGAFWDSRGVKEVENDNLVLSEQNTKYKLDERVHLTLAVMHYAVKRARNLVTEWGNLDIARHGILTGIGDLIRNLARIKGTEASIQICLYAVSKIETYYLEITPYGRVEPMNAYFKVAQDLFDSNKIQESNFCISILAWIAVHTKQLSADRSQGIEAELNDELKTLFASQKKNFRSKPKEVPTDINDPWKEWVANK